MKPERVWIGCVWNIFFGAIEFFAGNDCWVVQFSLVLARNKLHNRGMTIRLSRGSGWSVRCVAVAIALAFGASAFADTGKNVVMPLTQQQQTQRKARKACYTMTTVSRIPLECKQLAAIPTTSSPMSIYGHSPAKGE
jgi:hypothetical protein